MFKKNLDKISVKKTKIFKMYRRILQYLRFVSKVGFNHGRKLFRVGHLLLSGFGWLGFFFNL